MKNSGSTLADVLERAQRNLAAAKARITGLERKKNELFAVEEAAQKIVVAEIGEAQKEIQKIEAEIVLAGLHAEELADYPHVSDEILRWRNRKGFPVFALFALNSNNSFRISEATMDVPFASFYEDVKQRLQNHARDTIIKCLLCTFLLGLACVIWVDIAERSASSFHWGIIMAPAALVIGAIVAGVIEAVMEKKIYSITARYDGVIPPETKEKVRTAEKLFERVYLLTEVKKWKLQATARPRLDPLVLGLKTGHLFLIAEYDTTPIEEWVKREFAS